jgi:hypothetical protein
MLSRFIFELRAAFEHAVCKSGIIEYDLIIAGCRIRLRFVGPSLVPYTLPALAHLTADLGPQPDLTICLWDTVSTESPPPSPPWSLGEYRLAGRLFDTDDGTIAVNHNATTGTLSVLDRSSQTALFWVHDATALSIYVQAAPLQTILHWAMSAYGWQVVHAAAIGLESGGVLLIGNAGAGKSTTALAALDSDLRYLSDDKCLVRLTPKPLAFGLYNSGKLNADSLEQLAHLRALVSDRDRYGAKGKSLLFMHPVYTDRLTCSFPLRAILIPQLGSQFGPDVQSVSPSAALRVLGPSTLVWLPGADRTSLAFIAALVRSLPCYNLYLSPKLTENHSVIAAVIREHA